MNAGRRHLDPIAVLRGGRIPRVFRVREEGSTIMIRKLFLAFVAVGLIAVPHRRIQPRALAQSGPTTVVDAKTYQDLRWRSIGPHRGGRSTAAAGVRSQPGVFYMGATGGGVWKTENYGTTWFPVTDGQISTGSIGAIDVSDSNPSIVYVGTGSEAIRS